MQDLARARRVYTRLVERTLSLGTTTAAYFTTLHAEPCKVRMLDRRERCTAGRLGLSRSLLACTCPCPITTPASEMQPASRQNLARVPGARRVYPGRGRG